MKLWWKAFTYALSSFINDYPTVSLLVMTFTFILLPIAAIFWIWARIIIVIIGIICIYKSIHWIYNYFSSHMKDYIGNNKNK